MRRRARVDTNHAEIVDALRSAGCSVQTLASVGRGVPDLIVGYAGRNVLLEVKRGTGTSTADQVEWAAGWVGQYAVVRSAEEAIAAVHRSSSSRRGRTS
jgi:hypothetical protein